MAGDFDVRISGVRQSAGDAESAAAQARGIDLGGTVRRVGAAMPGGASVGAANALGEAWIDGLRAWADGMDRHADNLNGAAGRYQSDDANAGSSLDIVLPGASVPGGAIRIPGFGG